MDLPAAPIEVVVDLPDNACGMTVPLGPVLPAGFGQRATSPAAFVQYKTGGVCVLYEEHDLALHECCHRRMLHAQINLSDDPDENRRMKEEEVETCMVWYKRNGGKQ